MLLVDGTEAVEDGMFGETRSSWAPQTPTGVLSISPGLISSFSTATNASGARPCRSRQYHHERVPERAELPRAWRHNLFLNSERCCINPARNADRN